MTYLRCTGWTLATSAPHESHVMAETVRLEVVCHDAWMRSAARVALGAVCAVAIIGGVVLVFDDGAGDPLPVDAVATTAAPVLPGSPDGPSATTGTAPAEPMTTDPAAPADPGAVAPAGFELTTARVTAADGTVCELCLWLADSVELRNRGLMGVIDLAPADGMAFVYPQPHATRFWMKDTLLPLSIAFYAPDGEYMDAFDMQPCVAIDSDECQRYPTPTGFLIAVETAQGELATIGMLEGSTLDLLDLPCPPMTDGA